jgi:hypothetical protein
MGGYFNHVAVFPTAIKKRTMVDMFLMFKQLLTNYEDFVHTVHGCEILHHLG